MTNGCITDRPSAVRVRIRRCGRTASERARDAQWRPLEEKALKATEWIGKGRDDHHGELHTIPGGQTINFTVQQMSTTAPTDGQKDNCILPCDGIVTRRSGALQGRGLISKSAGKANGGHMVFVQGDYEHRLCFDHPRTRLATLYGIAQIVHSIETKSA